MYPDKYTQVATSDSPQQSVPVIILMVCGYIFLFIERPWESVAHLQGIQIERWYAVLMLVIGFLSNKIVIAKSPTNKWVYTLLLLHFVLAPFAFSTQFAVDTGIEYGKMVVLYLLMLAVVDSELTLKMLLKAYLVSTYLYALHSLLEYSNGRHEYRMGISRMVGVDQTYADPNAFGATLVLSLPIAYVMARYEGKLWLRRAYYSYFALVALCVILTGSRSSFIAIVLLFLLWGFFRQGKQKLIFIPVMLLSMLVIWNVMPEEKQTRIRSLWDEDAGPSNAHQSSKGRMEGWRVSLKMFEQRPWTGVGAGGDNFVGYRMTHQVDEVAGTETSPTQAHVLFGQVLAEFGVPGALVFAGMVLSIGACCLRARRNLAACGAGGGFLGNLGGAMVTCLLLLLLLGFAGHNFYRPLWLWLAAWSGSLLMLSGQALRARAATGRE
jgi:O-antigen ligase